MYNALVQIESAIHLSLNINFRTKFLFLSSKTSKLRTSLMLWTKLNRIFFTDVWDEIQWYTLAR